MQAVKDSFYMALRGHLAAKGISATAMAVAVSENESANGQNERDVFYLQWEGAQQLPQDARDAGWRALQCKIAYRTAGTEAAAGRDRGRCLAAMDEQLAAMLAARSAEICDFTVQPPGASGCRLLWTGAEFGAVEADGAEVKRAAEVTLLWREDAR